MHFQSTIFFKWLGVTLFCGAHSFFLGLMVNGNIGAMLIGMLTLALALTTIESHPFYQRKKAANPLLAHTVKLGLKIRLGLAVIVALSWTAGMFPNPWEDIVALPMRGEMLIGTGAMAITGLEAERGGAANVSPDFLASYATTLITAFIHTLILAAMCGIIYLVLRHRQRKKSSPSS